MRPDRVVTLASIHMRRMWRQLALIAATILLLASLDLVKHGVRPDSQLGWFLGGTLMVPFMQGMLIIREKTDGSLRFFATLPIAGAEHAAGRAVVALLLSLPAASVAFVGVRLNGHGLSLSAAIAIGLAATVVWAVLALGLTAMQLRTRIGTGARTALLLFTGIIVIGQVAPSVIDTGAFGRLRALLLTRDGLAAVSILVWMALAVCGWWSIRTIARIRESYEQDAADAL